MHYVLALDLGKRRTGVAFGESASQMVMALDTIGHKTVDELIDKLKPVIATKKVTMIYAGLPLLLSGEEGSQSTFVRTAAKQIEQACGIPVLFVDERYTTMGHGQSAGGGDDNARAACQILITALERKK